MAHRIDVELTSQSGDTTWTWRAAGAKQPRGTVDATLVPEGSGVGSVLRAEVEVTLDGTTVTALLPPKGKSTVRSTDRIEILGTPQRGPDVNVVLASRSKRRRDDRSEGGRDRDGGRRPSERGARSEGGDRRPRGESRGRTRGEAGASGDEGGSSRKRSGPARPGSRESGGRDHRRLTPSNTYRNAALATLPPEQLPVAEQLMKGGIPAVRQAIEEQNARARAEHRPEVTPGPLLTLAEELLPVITLASWKDRASAARAAGKDVPLRELRSIVASASTVTLDDEGTEMASAIRSSLDQRVTALRERWVERITSALDEGKVADAVRASIRPPEPAARLSSELAVRLAGAAGEAMSAETTPEAWLALLEVVVESPVRRTVKPQGLPTGADETVLAAARQASGYVPELARLMGIPIPPPPGPRRPVPARTSPGRRSS
ncbi:MAG: hypothetical protein ABSC90_13610 [Acidimicrobiales bacterium]|jgi:hypothetical protein